MSAMLNKKIYGALERIFFYWGFFLVSVNGVLNIEFLSKFLEVFFGK